MRGTAANHRTSSPWCGRVHSSRTWPELCRWCYFLLWLSDKWISVSDPSPPTLQAVKHETRQKSFMRVLIWDVMKIQILVRQTVLVHSYFLSSAIIEVELPQTSMTETILAFTRLTGWLRIFGHTFSFNTLLLTCLQTSSIVKVAKLGCLSDRPMAPA